MFAVTVVRPELCTYEVADTHSPKKLVCTAKENAVFGQADRPYDLLFGTGRPCLIELLRSSTCCQSCHRALALNSLGSQESVTVSMVFSDLRHRIIF